jgi:GDP-L-fucose synthase
MTVLVAGSTGLVGSAIAAAYESRGEKVIRVSRSIVDLTDSESTRRFLLHTKPTVVVDAAGKVGGIGVNNSYPVEFLTENIRIQSNLMAAAHEADVQKFIFLGSSCIYPRECAQPIREEYLLSGPLETTNSAYAIAKITGIELVNSYRKEFGHKWISLMPTNIYGPHDNFDLSSSHVVPALIRRFVEAVKLNSPVVTLWGSGSPLREFLHVDDLAQAVLQAGDSYDSSMHLNVGTGKGSSVLEIIQAFEKETGQKLNWSFGPRREGDVTEIFANATKAKNVLGWQANLTIKDAVIDAWNWEKKLAEQNEK